MEGLDRTDKRGDCGANEDNPTTNMSVRELEDEIAPFISARMVQRKPEAENQIPLDVRVGCCQRRRGMEENEEIPKVY